jgi:uncharacterized membrane protein (UPF0127 family)
MARPRYRLTGTDGQSHLGDHIERADNPIRRMVGLLGRRSLAPGEGLWFEPASSIHTFFMRFPIDVLFLDRENVVLRCMHSMPAFRVAAQRGARSLVELPPGTLEQTGVSAGDRLALEPAVTPSDGSSAA